MDFFTLILPSIFGSFFQPLFFNNFGLEVFGLFVCLFYMQSHDSKNRSFESGPVLLSKVFRVLCNRTINPTVMQDCLDRKWSSEV